MDRIDQAVDRIHSTIQQCMTDGLLETARIGLQVGIADWHRGD